MNLISPPAPALRATSAVYRRRGAAGGDHFDSGTEVMSDVLQTWCGVGIVPRMCWHDQSNHIADRPRKPKVSRGEILTAHTSRDERRYPQARGMHLMAAGYEPAVILLSAWLHGSVGWSGMTPSAGPVCSEGVAAKRALNQWTTPAALTNTSNQSGERLPAAENAGALLAAATRDRKRTARRLCYGLRYPRQGQTPAAAIHFRPVCADAENNPRRP